MRLNKTEDALVNHLKALEIEREIGNKNGIIHSSIYIGNIHLMNNEFNIAHNYFTSALDLAKEIKAKVK